MKAFLAIILVDLRFECALEMVAIISNLRAILNEYIGHIE